MTCLFLRDATNSRPWHLRDMETQQTHSRLRWQHGLGDGTRQARSNQALQPGQPFAQELDLRKQVRPPVFFVIKCYFLCCPFLDSYLNWVVLAFFQAVQV